MRSTDGLAADLRRRSRGHDGPASCAATLAATQSRAGGSNYRRTGKSGCSLEPGVSNAASPGPSTSGMSYSTTLGRPTSPGQLTPVVPHAKNGLLTLSTDHTHTLRIARQPRDWRILIAAKSPKRLIVFVHGWGGKPLSTWADFQHSGRIDPWWRDSDMAFAAYPSVTQQIAISSIELTGALDAIFPTLPAELLSVGGTWLPGRDPGHSYEELILIGHSLGGVLIRRAILDCAKDWLAKSTGEASQPGILGAKVILFSPAIGGFQPTGHPMAIVPRAVEDKIRSVLRASPSFLDLSPESWLIKETRVETEALASAEGRNFAGVRAKIAWAGREHLVVARRYSTDPPDVSIPDRTHVDVCKPNGRYTAPWEFAQRSASA